MISFNKFWAKVKEVGSVSVIENGEIKEMKLTQVNICKITGLSNNVLNSMLPIEPGKEYKTRRGNVSLNSIEILCNLLSCQPEDIMEYIDDERV